MDLFVPKQYRPTPQPFKPTHIHADGGLYELIIDDLQFKHPTSHEWLDMVLYRDAQGQLYARMLEEWEDRYKPIPTED